MVWVIFSDLIAIYKVFTESINRIYSIFYEQPIYLRIFTIQIAIKPVGIKLTNSALVLESITSITSIYFLDFQKRGPPLIRMTWPSIKNR